MDRIEQFKALMSEVPEFTEPYLKVLIEKLKDMGFFAAPASTKYHGNYPGGLFDHSYEVTKCLLELTRNMGLTWERERSPYVVGMFHDLCKCDQYIRNEDGTYGYENNLPLCGHGDKSAILVQQKFISITEEEMLCIRWHMGAYDDSKVWNNLGAAIERYPNVLWTHTADMMASRIKGV